MECNHEWVITARSDTSEDLIATHGWLYLNCVFCDGQARVVRPTAAEVAQVAEIRRAGSYPIYTDTGDGRLMVIDRDHRGDGQLTDENGLWPPDDDVLTADDGGSLDAIGTIGWKVIEGGAFNDDAAAECDHDWVVNGVYGANDESDTIEVYCPRCHKYAMVTDPLEHECRTIVNAWNMGTALVWQDVKRLVLYDDVQTPPVADLVNALNLFEGDDYDDVPF